MISQSALPIAFVVPVHVWVPSVNAIWVPETGSPAGPLRNACMRTLLPTPPPRWPVYFSTVGARICTGALAVGGFGLGGAPRPPKADGPLVWGGGGGGRRGPACCWAAVP